MVGLGETEDEVFKLMDDVLDTGCDILTIGQYLRPTPNHIEVPADVAKIVIAYEPI